MNRLLTVFGRVLVNDDLEAVSVPAHHDNEKRGNLGEEPAPLQQAEQFLSERIPDRKAFRLFHSLNVSFVLIGPCADQKRTNTPESFW